jgi:hypothetical protein
MLQPVGNLPNNWAEVAKGDQGKYLAQIGKETFEVMIKLSLPSGRILSAEMDNPVEVLERECDDAALLKCGHRFDTAYEDRSRCWQKNRSSLRIDFEASLRMTVLRPGSKNRQQQKLVGARQR